MGAADLSDKMDLRYEFYESIDSTNDEIKRRIDDAATPLKEGLVISAGLQSAGRGRSGHTWSSPAGSSVATSLLIRPDGVDQQVIPLITIHAAVAVCRLMDSLIPSAARIKWPNDVLLNNKKVSGILVERILSHDESYIIIGIGVNVSRGSYPPELSDHAVSIEEAGGLSPSHDSIIRGIWERFDELYGSFRVAQDLSAVRLYYNDHLINLGRRVIVKDPRGEYEAVARSIDDTGRLEIETDKGEHKFIDSGEVSVRGIDGYV